MRKKFESSSAVETRKEEVINIAPFDRTLHACCLHYEMQQTSQCVPHSEVAQKRTLLQRKQYRAGSRDIAFANNLQFFNLPISPWMWLVVFPHQEC
jgi:hypothetical protein